MRMMEIELASVGDEPGLRLDAKYRLFRATGGKLFRESLQGIKETPLCELLVERPAVVVKKGADTLPKSIPLVDLEDVEPKTGKATVREVAEIGSDRLVFDGWDVLTNRLRPYLGKTFVSPSGKGIMGSTEWIPMKARRTRLLPRVLQALLLCPEYAQVSRLLMSGKNHPRISEFDLGRIVVPELGMDIQEKIEKIALTAEAAALKQEQFLRSDDDIVVEILGKRFGIPDLASIRLAYGKGMTNGTQVLPKRPLSFFECPVSDIDESFSLRFSARCLRPQNERLDELLTSVGSIRAWRWLRAIRKGDQPAYVENGDVPVVKTGSIQEWQIDLSEAQKVSHSYFLTKQSASVSQGQVVVAATGFASLGKAAVYMQKKPALVSVDLLVLDFVENNADPRFFVHYLRSPLGFFQMETAFTGTTNQIHIYQEHIKNLRVPDIPKTLQSEIADEIDAALKENEKVRKDISLHRLEAVSELRKILGLPTMDGHRQEEENDEASYN